MQACRLRSHTVDVTPPQAATKIMAGMAEWRNGGMAGMAGMAVRRKEWQNSRMAEMATYVLFTVDTHRRRRRRQRTLIFYSIES